MNHNTHRLLFVDGITEDGYFANTFEVQEPFSENVEYMGRLHFTDKVNPRPIKALFDEDGVLQRIEYLDINPLFPKEIHLRKEKVNFKKISTSDLRRLMKSTRDTPKKSIQMGDTSWQEYQLEKHLQQHMESTCPKKMGFELLAPTPFILLSWRQSPKTQLGGDPTQLPILQSTRNTSTSLLGVPKVESST